MSAAVLQTILQGIKFLPASLGLKALAKFNPKFNNYFTQAAAYGYDANQALDYLSKRFENPAQGEFEEHLEGGNLRTDEKAARQQLAPSRTQGKALRTAAAFGGAALLGGGKSGAVSPSQILPAVPAPAQLPGPTNAPQIGMQQRGFTMQPSPPTPQGPIAGAAPPPRAQLGGPPVPQAAQAATPGGGFSPFDFLAQYDPMLAQTLFLNVQHGVPPNKAAKNLKNVQKFEDPIKSIEEDTDEQFEDFVHRLFGGVKRKSKPTAQAQAQEALAGQQPQAQQQGPNVNQQLIELIRAARQSIPRQ